MAIALGCGEEGGSPVEADAPTFSAAALSSGQGLDEARREYFALDETGRAAAIGQIARTRTPESIALLLLVNTAEEQPNLKKTAEREMRAATEQAPQLLADAVHVLYGRDPREYRAGAAVILRTMMRETGDQEIQAAFDRAGVHPLLRDDLLSAARMQKESRELIESLMERGLDNQTIADRAVACLRAPDIEARLLRRPIAILLRLPPVTWTQDVRAALVEYVTDRTGVEHETNKQILLGEIRKRSSMEPYGSFLDDPRIKEVADRLLR